MHRNYLVVDTLATACDSVDTLSTRGSMLSAGRTLESCMLTACVYAFLLLCVSADGTAEAAVAAADDEGEDGVPMATTESAAALLATTVMPRLPILYDAAATPTAVWTTCSVNFPASLPYLHKTQALFAHGS